MKKTNKEGKEYSYYSRYKEDHTALIMFGLITLIAGMALSNVYVGVLGVVELITYWAKVKKEENLIYYKKGVEEEKVISRGEYDKHVKGGK